MKQDKPNMSAFSRWFKSVRPFSFILVALPIAYGIALAACDPLVESVNWWSLIIPFMMVLFIVAGANLLGDVFDHKYGLNNNKFDYSGGVDKGYITGKQAYRAAMWSFVIAIALCVLIWFLNGINVFLLFFAGLLLSFLYSAGRHGLKYIAMGDLAVFLSFGILVGLSAYYFVRGSISTGSFLFFLPIAFTIVASLHSKNMRNVEVGPQVYGKTFAVLIGRKYSLIYLILLLLLPFVFDALVYFNVIFLENDLPVFPGKRVFILLPAAIYIIFYAIKAYRLRSLKVSQNLNALCFFYYILFCLLLVLEVILYCAFGL